MYSTDHLHPTSRNTMGKSKDLSYSHKSMESKKSYSIKSHASAGSKKKKLTIHLKSLALHQMPQPGEEENPIAIRDFPDDCNDFLPDQTPQDDPPMMPEMTSSTRHKRRLHLAEDSDEEDPQPHQKSQVSSDYASASATGPTAPDSPAAVNTAHVPAPPTMQPTVPAINDTANNIPSATPAACQTPGEPDQYLPYLWHSYSVHEVLNAQENRPSAPHFSAEYLAAQGTPNTEIQEYLNYRHAFPHVPQALFPSVRPDGTQGQYYHLTQLPVDTDIDTDTGLAPTYQVTIRFDNHYHTMSKSEVQNAAIARLGLMRIPLSNRFREPVTALVTQSGWMGFLKIDLLNPATDGIALLQGHRIFTLQLQNGEYVVGKAEKGFEFNSTATNRRLRMQSPALNNYASRQLLAELIKLGYSSGRSLEFIGVSKRTRDQTFADITVANEKTKLHLRQYPIFLQGEKIQVTVPPTAPTSNHTDTLTTSLIVKGIPLQYSQLQITVALHRLMGAKNITNVNYANADTDSLGRHDGSAIVRCMNAAVYTHWSNQMAVPLLGKFVDFIPHRRSLGGSHPTAAARAHDARPTREVIADELAAFQNQLPAVPSIQQLENSLRDAETRIDAKLAGLRDNINIHTTNTAATSTAATITRQDNLLRQLKLLTTASQEYSKQMIGISSAIIQGQDAHPMLRMITLF